MKRKKDAALRYRLPSRSPKSRIFEIDFLRGFDILLMSALHFCYAASSVGVMGILFDVSSAHNGTIEAMNRFCFNVFFAIVGTTGIPLSTDGQSVFILFCLEAFFAGLFVFLSGISCSFARNNLERGIQLALVAEVETHLLIILSVCIKNLSHGLSFAPTATSPYDHAPSISIIMGILQAIAFALIVFALFDHFFPKYWQTLLGACFFIAVSGFFLYLFYTPVTGPLAVFRADNRGSDGSWPRDWWRILLGSARYGDDYFPPLLMCSVMFLGAAAGKILYRKRRSLLPSSFPTKWAKPILFIGRHTLLIYLIHQPFNYVFLAILYRLCGYAWVS